MKIIKEKENLAKQIHIEKIEAMLSGFSCVLSIRFQNLSDIFRSLNVCMRGSD